MHQFITLIQLLAGLYNNTKGVLIKFLPPYSPDMNSIESIFGEVKHYLQAD